MRKLLTRSIRQALVLGLALFSMSCETPEAAPGYTVRAAHPRIWLTPSVLERLRSGAASGSPRWQALKQVCDTYITSTSRSNASTMNYALAYQVSGNPAYADKAIALAQETVDKGMPAIFVMGKYGYSVRDVLPEVALCYDWCYDRLSSEQRVRFRQQLEAWSDWVWPETNPERATGWAVTNAGNNFYHGFMMTWLVGLALHGDSPKAAGYIGVARERYLEQVRPHLETYGKGGYLLEGTNYGTGSRIFWYLSAHSTATDENLLTAPGFDWAREATLCRLYLTTPTRDRVYPGGAQARDARAPISDYMRGTALVASSYLDPVTAGYAKWWLDHVKPERNIWRFMQWEEFLWYRDDVMAIDYTRVLPPGYRAPGSGLMTSRSSWATDAVQVVMMCGPTRESHQDMAQNGFAIFRGDWLAGMARLKAHGGLKRDTESHNTLTIGGAGQVGEQVGAKVVHFVDTPHYAYMVGDARDAYDRPKYKSSINVLDEFRRELLFLKPGVVLIFDRVSAVDGQKEKKWHLHSLEEPVVGEDSYQTTAGGSILFGTRLLPREAVVQKLPLYFGRNKTLSTWRIDIAAPLGNQVDHFLNVLEAAPATQMTPTPVAALSTGRDSLMGAQVGSRAVLFDVEMSSGQPVVYQAGPDVREHYVLNREPGQCYRLTEVKLKSGQWYQVTREAKPQQPGIGRVARASKEGVVWFGPHDAGRDGADIARRPR